MENEINPKNYFIFIEHDLGGGNHITTNFVWRKYAGVNPKTKDLKTAPFKFVDFKLESNDGHSELTLELENLGNTYFYKFHNIPSIKSFLGDLGIKNTKQFNSLRGSYMEGYFLTKNKLRGICAHDPVQVLKDKNQNLQNIVDRHRGDEELEGLLGDDFDVDDGNLMGASGE